MFNREIACDGEPGNPGLVHQESNERVDMAIEDADGKCLYLGEIKTPLVLGKFENYIGDSETHEILLRDHATTGENVLNKVRTFYLPNCIREADYEV